MKKIMSMLLIVTLLLGLVSCGGGDSGSDPKLGKYLPHTAEMFGITMTAEELFGSPDSFTLELKSGGKMTLQADGEKGDGTYKLDGENITMTVKVDSDEMTMTGRLVDNMLYLENMLDAGINIAFYKEGTTPVEAAVTPTPEPVDETEEETDVPDDNQTDGTDQQGSSDQGVFGNYYGTAYHKNANENFFFGEELPIWAYLGQDSSGNVYFEIYAEEDHNSDSVLVSMWVMMFDNQMVPHIGEEDAWIYDMYLDIEDTSALTVNIENDTIVMDYMYREVDEGVEYFADVTFYLLKEGTPWKEPNF